MENKNSKTFSADKFTAKAAHVISLDDYVDIDNLINLQQKYDANYQLLKKQEELLSITSHELKTPITTIMLFLSLLEKLTEKEENPRVLELVQKTETQVNRLVKLVNNLQDMTALQNGKIELRKEIFNFSALVKSCADTFRLQNPEFELIIEENTIIDIYADSLRIEQVLINFISNAIKYSPHAGRILIYVESTLDLLKVSVTDSGIGMPEAALPHVFDCYFRAYPDDNRFKGNGLGLYISKEIIVQHEGEIGVISQENKGSTFWFTLPFQKMD
ncbi:sensor histidine kinase [Mucilaginibacter arboris]|nr:HAMP domain-containing sensor histidine kinase [Mucilaginibacter arboris]